MHSAENPHKRLVCFISLFLTLAVAQSTALFPNATDDHEMAPSQPGGVFEPPAGPYNYVAPQVPLDPERYPVAPPGLELEQVHIYVRHGALPHSVP